MYFECESVLRSEDGFTFPDLYFSMAKLLATQSIHFEDHGLPRGSGLSFIVGTHVDMHPHGRWLGGWLVLIENYSKGNLTKPQDKLPALSGLARVIAQETNDQYFAGLWLNHLIEDLHWRVYAQDENNRGCPRPHHPPTKGKVLGNIRKPDEYRAPSWSWASLDAPIRFVPLSYGDLVAKVLNCSTMPVGSDKFGRVSGGKLDIEVSKYISFL
jgi:hypothetical protein